MEAGTQRLVRTAVRTETSVTKGAVTTLVSTVKAVSMWAVSILVSTKIEEYEVLEGGSEAPFD